ncbi:MAG TPA: polysaccharide deacetylase family protein [Polyangiaceae bacterium]|jgi:peptidoglycan/xylan/chitin deacetylase (PgdA/CDA1 family)
MRFQFGPCLVLCASVTACTANSHDSTVSAGTGGSGGAGAIACSSNGFAWPKGASAAISLTYDDALTSQLKYAVPVLDAKSLKATFFLSEFWWEFNTYKPQWGALAASEHELASHTVKHPCQKELPGYTLDQMGAELDQNVATLRSLGATGRLTFAYPCGATELGTPSTSYIPAVTSRFLAARGTNWAVANPSNVDLGLVPSMLPPTSATGNDLTDLVKQAESNQGWLVLGFHGISDQGEYLNIPQASHDALCDYLAMNAARLWVAPFGTVADYVSRCR